MENKKQLDEYVQTFFEEIKRFDFDIEKGTFNGYPASEIRKYYDHLHFGVEGLEERISNYLEFLHDDNQISPEEFDDDIVVVTEIRKKIEEVERGIIQSQADVIASFYQLENTDSLYKGMVNATKVVNTIIFSIHYVLDKYICRENGVYYHETSIDKINFETGNLTNSENPILIPVQTTNKLTLNLSQKEIALIFLSLTQMGIIHPQSKTELYKFIENNFRYKDNSKAKNEIKDVKGINVVSSRLTDYNIEDENKKFIEKFIKKFSNQVLDFIENIDDIDFLSFRDLP